MIPFRAHLTLRYHIVWSFGFCYCLSGTVIKNPPADAGDPRNVGSILGSGRSPGEGNGNPLQYSCLENPHGQSSLAGYSPLGCKESDTTEHLSTAHSFSVSLKGYILFLMLELSVHEMGSQEGDMNVKEE